MSGTEDHKRAVRHELLHARTGLTPDQVSRAASVLAERALGLTELADARTVAGYVSMGGEPGTGPLLDALRARGVRVLLPVLLPDNDLDWGEYAGQAALTPAKYGLLEPAGPRLGTSAIVAADAVLLPGVAVDARGVRLGRGGGSYDRVLERLTESGVEPALAVLLYDHEVVAHVPAEAHDRPVHAAVTPSGVHRFAERD
ncbi:5-formyltetrahydrofolate cyclo-ligase [Streptomyces xiaopingdaonensis]|uniref:5-formyltetrahydrofolate cyclo-ligase n=1 Tax=Streptomyces xiaopingdaonensis TaxID=1565415 RepID=UPI0002FAC9CB|nr:5-formyltetrahydrofolate cyclo-ligase [Streptomyces xiaopingdaonensis]